MAIYAQNWTIDGNIDLYLGNIESNDNWLNNRSDSNQFSLNVNFGRYVTDKINIGLRAGF